jgi:hypothetical protein
MTAMSARAKTQNIMWSNDLQQSAGLAASRIVSAKLAYWPKSGIGEWRGELQRLGKFAELPETLSRVSQQGETGGLC